MKSFDFALISGLRDFLVFTSIQTQTGFTHASSHLILLQTLTGKQKAFQNVPFEKVFTARLVDFK